MLISTSSLVALLLIAAMMTNGAAAADAVGFDGCNATVDNSTVNTAYLEDYGNVTVSIPSAKGLVAAQALLSFCTPSNVTANNKVNCGPAFLAIAGDTCPDSLLFDVVTSDLTVINNKTTRLDLSSSHNAAISAIVYLTCQAGLDAVLTAANVTVLQNVYTFQFSSEFVCAGYVPASSSNSGPKLLSKGAIVGIIIGIVAVVVIAAALFQWRAKSNSGSESYQRL